MLHVLDGNVHFKPTTINMSRFCSAKEGVDKNDFFSSFFDGDHTVYGKLNLGGAMTTAGYTPEEQAFFYRCANLMTRPVERVRVSHVQPFSDSEEEAEEEVKDEEEVRGTQV